MGGGAALVGLGVVTPVLLSIAWLAPVVGVELLPHVSLQGDVMRTVGSLGVVFAFFRCALALVRANGGSKAPRTAAGCALAAVCVLRILPHLFAGETRSVAWGPRGAPNTTPQPQQQQPWKRPPLHALPPPHPN